MSETKAPFHRLLMENLIAATWHEADTLLRTGLISFTATGQTSGTYTAGNTDIYLGAYRLTNTQTREHL